MSRAAKIGLSVALFGWLLIAIAVWWLWPVIGQIVDPHWTRTFFIPSESMMPTLHVDDHVRPHVAVPADLRPGVVIVFNGPETARVDRIAAVAGDTVQVRGGVVLVNGRTATARNIGPGPPVDGEPTRLMQEQLPGERGVHRLLDAGPSIGDEFGPVRVPAGSLFVLGDNRDRSADSRYPVADQGVGMVAVSDVIGVVDRLLWAKGFRERGRPIDEVRP